MTGTMIGIVRMGGKRVDTRMGRKMIGGNDGVEDVCNRLLVNRTFFGKLPIKIGKNWRGTRVEINHGFVLIGA